jgi:hypothetical protein
MDLSKVLEQLRTELVHLDAAILSLERLQARATRRGPAPGVIEEPRKAHAAGRRQARRGAVPPANKQRREIPAGSTCDMASSSSKPMA